MQADQDWPEHLTRAEQMPQVGPREWGVVRGLPAVPSRVAGVAVAPRLNRERVGGVLVVLEPDLTGGRERVGVAAVARWEHAVEHVHPRADRGQYVPLVADPHQVARLGIGEER